MAETKDSGKAGVVIGSAAAVVAAIALARRVQAAPGTVILDPAIKELLIAIAEAQTGLLAGVGQLIALVEKLQLTGAFQGWPPNTDGITSLRVAIAVTGTQLPYIAVPSGMSLVIKAWALNPGWLQVGASLAECTSINQSFPLLPNEVVGYFVQNAEQLYIAATVAGCFACLTVEQRKGGG